MAIIRSALDLMLNAERHRARAADNGRVSLPVMSERPATPEDDPILASNSRGEFTLTPRTKGGTARFAYFRCELPDEELVLERLRASLLSLSGRLGNRAGSVQEALDAFPLAATTLVVPQSLLGEVLGKELSNKDIADAMAYRGYVAELEGLKVLVAQRFPAGAALVCASPVMLGLYSRVGGSLGLQLRNVRETVTVVEPYGLG